MKLTYPSVKDWDFIAPELIPSRLCGKVYGSEKFSDGTNVVCSSIQRMFEEQGVIIIETRNSKYIIRKENIDSGYEQAYGDVWEKLLEKINE